MQSAPLSSIITRLSFMLPTLLGVLPALPTYAQAQALPQGGTVASGNVRINTPSSSQMNIHQQSNSAIVNWNSFNVGKGAQVNIQQPGKSSTLLNRVTGNTSSTIAGKISANGQVYLVNPNGIMITPTGQVNTAGFVASTLDIDDEDFKAGRRNFKGKGKSASVVNQGTITINKGGYAALMGGEVSNSGTVTVPMGKVGLASGERVTLDLTGDGFMQVELPSNASGSKVLVENSGRIVANGGRVEMKAATARNAARRAVNMSGVVEARSVEGKSGSIVLGGGQGEVVVSGTLDASGGKTEKGGNIQVTGHKIALQKATVDASGGKGGGKVRVGGGRKGGEGIQRAETVTMEKDSIIRASATDAGNGGDVVVWSDKATTFAGKIVATGGAESGNGGEVEVSGEAWLGYTGHVDLTAANGKFGNLLLDPYNVTISTGADTGGFTAGANNSVINVTTLQNALASANVTVSTGSGGSQEGNITVANNIAWSSGSTLTLDAAKGININAQISINGAGGLALNYLAGETNLKFSKAGAVTYAGGGSIAGQTLTVNGNPYTLVYTMAQLDAIDGRSGVDHTVITAYGTSGVTGRYALANSFDASGITYANSPIAQFGPTFSGVFNGLGNTISNLSMNTTRISSGALFGTTSGTAVLRNINLRNASLINNSATTQSTNHGLLVGQTLTTQIHQVSVSGVITANASTLGGIVGSGVDANIYNSDADVVITSYNPSNGGAFDQVGGIAGSMSSSGSYGDVGIHNSHATGTINGKTAVGGLVGHISANGSTASAAIIGSSFIGTVNGLGFSSLVQKSGVGGLVGSTLPSNGGIITIDSSFAKGFVNGNSTSQGFGGLVGIIGDGSAAANIAPSVTNIINSYSESIVKNGGNSNGGLVGYIRSKANITNSYATGNVNGGTGQNNGGLIGETRDTVPVTISNVYSTGAIFGGTNTAGFIGSCSATCTITNGYWNMGTSGHATAFGTNLGTATNVVGMTTAQLQNGGLPTGFSTGWAGGIGGLNPYLTSIYTNGVKAITGFESRLTTASQNQSVGYIHNGVRSVAPVSVGADGSYYILVDAAALADGETVIVQNTNHATNTGAVQKNITGASTNFGTLNAGVFTIYANTVSDNINETYNNTAAAINGNTGIENTLTALNERRYIREGGDMVIDQSIGFGADKWFRYFADGDITINNGVSVAAGKIDVVAGENFINNSGAGALVASDRWFVRAANPATSSFNGLNSSNTAVWSAGSGLNWIDNLASFEQSGNRYYFGITPTLTVTTTNLSKVYGDTADVSNSYTLSGLHEGVTNAFLGDTLSSISTGNFAIASNGAAASANVGSYGIDVTQDTLAMTSGYNVAFASDGQLTVTPRAITLTAADLSRIYGNSNPALTYALTSGNLVNGDTLSGGLTTTANATSNVGNYAINQGDLAASSNYTLTFVNGNLGVTARAITVTAADLSRTYGNSNPALAYTVSNGTLVNGDTLSGGLTTTANATSNVGNYAITQGNLGNTNYAITYVAGNLDVVARAITVKADGQARVYGNNNAALTYAITSGNLVNGDTLEGNLATTATAQSNKGSYAITQGDLAASSNYAVTFDAGILDVTARAISVKATDSIWIKEHGTVPLSYVITQGSLANGDTLSGAVATSANASSPLGNYAITQGTLAASSNYTMDFTGGTVNVMSAQSNEVNPNVSGITAPTFSSVLFIPKFTLPQAVMAESNNGDRVWTWAMGENREEEQ